MILLCSTGMGAPEVALKFGAAQSTVNKWRRRFADVGLSTLHDRTRPNTDRKLSDEKVEETTDNNRDDSERANTLEYTSTLKNTRGKPKFHKSSLAWVQTTATGKALSLSVQTTFSQRRSGTSSVGLYMNRPDNAMVLCVDEKSQIQALERMQPVLPMLLGQPRRKTPSYFRHGTTTLFAALDIATGKVIGKCYPRYRAIELREFLSLVNGKVPAEIRIHIVMDNYATHSTPEIQSWLESHPRFHFHFIPTYSSWLNQVERWFGLLTQRALKKGVHRSTKELESAIREYIYVTNEDPKPFIWAKSADQIIASVLRHCQLDFRLPHQWQLGKRAIQHRRGPFLAHWTVSSFRFTTKWGRENPWQRECSKL